HRGRHRGRYGRGVEGAHPRPDAGALRRAGVVAMGHFARRVEPVGLPGDGRRMLRCLLAPSCTAAASRDAARDCMTVERAHRLPGDRQPPEEIARMLRVDHAGEYGATRIYQGQLDVLGRSRGAGEIRRMAETEKRHLARFEELLHELRVRPTLFYPL